MESCYTYHLKPYCRIGEDIHKFVMSAQNSSVWMHQNILQQFPIVNHLECFPLWILQLCKNIVVALSFLYLDIYL